MNCAGEVAGAMERRLLANIRVESLKLDSSSCCSTPTRGLVSPHTKQTLRDMTNADLVNLLASDSSSATAASSAPRARLGAACELLQRAESPANRTAIGAIPGVINGLVALLHSSSDSVPLQVATDHAFMDGSPLRTPLPTNSRLNPTTPNTPTRPGCGAASHGFSPLSPGVPGSPMSPAKAAECAALERKTAAALMWMLTINHEENQAQIGREPAAITGLVALLHSKNTDADMRANAVGALMNLCSTHAENRVRVAQEPGAIAGLVGLLSGEDAAAVRKYAACTLGRLAGCSIHCGKAGTGSSTGAASSSSAGKGSTAAASTSSSSAGEGSAGSEGGSPSPTPAAAAAGPQQQAAASSGASGDASAAATGPTAASSSNTAAQQQNNPCSQVGHTNSSGIIQDQSLISKLVVLLRDGDAGVRTQAATTLRILGSTSAEARSRISQEEAYSVSPGVLARCDFFTVGKNLDELLLQCLSPLVPETLRLGAAAALHRQAGTAAGKAALGSHAGAIEGVVSLLHDPSAGLRKQAAGVLWAMCTAHTDHQRRVGQEPGAISALVSLLSDEVAGVSRHALGALSVLAQHNAQNQVLISQQQGVVSKLFEVLRDEEAAGVVHKQAASLLLALSGNAGSRMAVVQELPPEVPHCCGRLASKFALKQAEASSRPAAPIGTAS